jgi:hypothetical protein
VQRSDTSELHLFVKAGMAYMGIMAGFAVLGLTFYAIVARGEAMGSSSVPAEAYYATMLYYAALASASVLAIWLLKNGRRAGAYLVFAILSISVLAPVRGSALDGFTIIYWFAIPNVAVSLLLLKAIRTLR